MTKRKTTLPASSFNLDELAQGLAQQRAQNAANSSQPSFQFRGNNPVISFQRPKNSQTNIPSPPSLPSQIPSPPFANEETPEFEEGEEGEGENTMDVSNGLPNPGNGPGYYYVPPNAFITTNLSSSPSAPASIRRPTPTGRGPGRALGSRFPSGYRKLSGLNPEDLEHIEQILSQKFIDLEKKQEEKRLKELAWFQSVLNTGADITSKAPPKTSTKKHLSLQWISERQYILVISERLTEKMLNRFHSITAERVSMNFGIKSANLKQRKILKK